jgi:alkanesulfonate monooxygenase SsuD/methylene tetrahydromethanopterin reductase-like flavin-dependent oxidoreductase (luciferase family)
MPKASPIKIGLLLPQGYFNEFEGWAPSAAWDRILDVARLGERLGFDSLWTGEHVLAKWDPEGFAFDCVTLHTAVAAAVPRVDIGFGVINSTFRNPAMTAKMAATLDTISGGRVILGLGAGFKESEARAFGQPYPPLKERMAILSEHFEIISRMTRRDEAPFTFEGAHARVEDVANVPRTGGGDHVRLAIGGHGRNVTFRLAARYCDEVNIDASPDEMADAIAAVRGRCEEIGRDPDSLLIVGGTNPAWPYPGLRAIGRQRMMRQEDVPAIMSADFSTLTTRTEEFGRWVELGLDRIICGVPGLVDTDEGLYELIDDVRAAGIEFVATPASA